jgi:hypothetical protein
MHCTVRERLAQCKFDVNPAAVRTGLVAISDMS